MTIAALTAGGDADQITFHVRRGLENGLARDEVTEAITHLAFYAGWPKAFSALPVATKAMAEAAPRDDRGAADGPQLIAPEREPIVSVSPLLADYPLGRPS